jgi:hypothetical protein
VQGDNSISAAINPLDVNDSLWTWIATDQTESGGSSPYSADMAWSAGVAETTPREHLLY